MLKTINKNILEVDSGIICHQVNCMGVMGSGLAKQIRDKWPDVYKNYSLLFFYTKKEDLLGDFQFVKINNSLEVVNVFGQFNYGKDKKQTDYAALDKAFLKMSRYKNHFKFKEWPIYFPHRFGCGLAGGDWTIVEPLIEKYFPTSIICKPDYLKI